MRSRKKLEETIGETRRVEIAHVLLKVIAEHGFDKASLRLVAREAGCTTGVLSHHFLSKENLVCHAVTVMFDWLDEQLLRAKQESNRLEALQIAVGLSLKAQPMPADFWAVWLQVLSRAKQSRSLLQIINERNSRWCRALAELVTEGQARGEIRNDADPSLLADFIDAVSVGLGFMAPIEPKRLSKKRKEELAKFLVGILRPQ